MAPALTDEPDSSSEEGVEVAAPSVDVGLQAHAVPPLGQTAVEDPFPHHDLQRQEGPAWAHWAQMSNKSALNTRSAQQGRDAFS